MEQIETLNNYKIKFVFNLSSPPSFELLKLHLNNKLGNDLCNVKFICNEDDILEFKNPSDNELNLLLNFFYEYVEDQGDYCLGEIEFIKKIGELNIYSPIALYKNLSQKSFEHFYNSFNQILDENGSLLINSNEEFKFNTTFSESNKSSRESILENWGFFTNIQGINNPQLLPTDFFDPDTQIEDQNFKKLILLFKKFSYMLSLIFLSDVIAIKENQITLKINGYNRLSYKIDFANIEFMNFDQLQKIYKWVYTSDITILADDKIAFAKDQLSRKLNFSDDKKTLSIDESALPSILSMHRIYLKENANQYIETTNTVAELISKIAIQQKEIQSSLISSFKNTSSVFLGLFISLLVFNSLSSGKATVFNSQNFYLTVIFALISLVALLVSRRQFENDLLKLESQFTDTKNIYKNLFNVDDLNKLFSDDYLTKLKNNLNKTKDFYTLVWFFEVFLVLTLISLLSFTDWLNF